MDSAQLHRFMAKFHREGECWVWHAGKSRAGYGVFAKDHQSAAASHRVSYEHFSGPIAPGLQIDHLCRNRACCNPAHLEAVTPLVNTLRSQGVTARNASKLYCAMGHRFDVANTIIRPAGGRACLQCRRDRMRVRNDEIKIERRQRGLRKPGIPAGQWPKIPACKYGHEFTSENTLVRKNGHQRTCRACAARRIREFKSRKESVPSP